MRLVSTFIEMDWAKDFVDLKYLEDDVRDDARWRRRGAVDASGAS